MLRFRADVWDNRHTPARGVPFRPLRPIRPHNPLSGISNGPLVLEVSSNDSGQNLFHGFRQITCCITMGRGFTYYYAPFLDRNHAVIGRGTSVMPLERCYAR